MNQAATPPTDPLVILALGLAVASFIGLLIVVAVRQGPNAQNWSVMSRIDVLEKKVARLEAENARLERENADLRRQQKESAAAQAGLVRALSHKQDNAPTLQPRTFPASEATNFRRWLVRYFDKAALELLAADVGVAKDDVDGPTAENMAQNLIDWCARFGVAQELREAARRARPQPPVWGD